MNERGTMDVALFEKAVADLTDALGVWNAKLAKAKKDQPRLALLNPLETAQFLSTLSVCTVKGQHLFFFFFFFFLSLITTYLLQTVHHLLLFCPLFVRASLMPRACTVRWSSHVRPSTMT